MLSPEGRLEHLSALLTDAWDLLADEPGNERAQERVGLLLSLLCLETLALLE